MEKLIVIAPYPPKGSIHGNRYSAVASYTKNTLDAIKANSRSETDFIVIAEILDKKTNYKEDGFTVYRAWKRNSVSIFGSLLEIISKYTEHNKILFEFEFGMFGGNKFLILLLPLFIGLLRLMGKEVHLVCHGVILTADEVGAQLGLENSPLKRNIFNIGLKVLYWMVMTFSNTIIVFEQYLKDRIVRTLKIPRNKIFVIPHGVESNRQHYGIDEARKSLGLSTDDFILTCFGFLIWYKGSDWLIKSFVDLHNQKKIPTNTKLVMAGGFSATHKEDPIYKDYINKTQELIKSSNGSVIFTDFLPEEKIDLYFSASDMIVLPHRVLISASGPFSFVITHKKPFLLSKALIGYKSNKDFDTAMERAGVSEDKVFFGEITTDDLGNLINSYYKNEEALSRMSSVSTRLMEERNWITIGKKYYETIFAA